WEYVNLDGANVTTVFYEPWSGSLAAASDGLGLTLMSVGASATDTESDPIVLPVTIALTQNYPNPFNPTTAIGFDLPESSPVRLAVYDLLGREVQVLANGQMTAGRHEVRFDAADLPSGTYLYRLETSAGAISKTMSLLK
ncbi:MAG: hypothetical protein ACI9W4_002898, partial [Rhodothermales bacterium]